MRRLMIVLAAVVMCLSLGACQKSGGMKDGYYTAQANGYSHGWREFVTITVKGGKLKSVEYNAENESGFIKSWDNAYMKNMLDSNGTYPNEYTRNYAAQLMETGRPDQVDAISGASTSVGSFQKLAAAAMEQSVKGDSHVAVVDTE